MLFEGTQNDSFQDHSSTSCTMEVLLLVFDLFSLNWTLLDNCPLSLLNFNTVKPNRAARCK